MLFKKKIIHLFQDSWRKVIATAVTLGIPTPAFSTALAFFDGYRSARLPANLIQVKETKDFINVKRLQVIDNSGKI